MQGFFGICKLVKRLDRPDGDFVKEVAEDEGVRFYIHAIGQHLVASEVRAREMSIYIHLSYPHAG